MSMGLEAYAPKLNGFFFRRSPVLKHGLLHVSCSPDDSHQAAAVNQKVTDSDCWIIPYISPADVYWMNGP
jgi:hypothetical protein